MDIVYLHDIEVDCVIGVWDWEREITQRLRIDVEIGYELRAAGNSDDLDDTLNYQEIVDAIREYCIERKAKLLETLAAGMAEQLLSSFGCRWCKIKINKPGAVRGVKDIGVIIERTAT